MRSSSQMQMVLDQQIILQNPDAPFERYHYPYYVRSGSEAMEQLTLKLQELDADRFLLLVDAGLPQPSVQRVQEVLTTIAPCSLHVIPRTEQAKNLLMVQKIGDEAIKAGASRSTVIVGLGGALTGNLAGLLSSLLYRGATRLIQMPTTFLAMSDSCLSLKQGVNSAWGKNHYGQFKAPLFVWCDLSFLQTLPPVEIRSALCELIKNVLAITPDRYNEIAQLLRADANYTHEHLLRFLNYCLDAKCLVLREDAHEVHRALLLEYGHTIGHAIEMLSHETGHPISHGFAIGMGLSIEAEIAYRLDLLSQRNVQAHEYLLQLNQVPPLPSLHLETLMQILRQDHCNLSRNQGKIAMVLLTDLGVPNTTGDSLLTQVDESVVLAVLLERFGGTR